MHRIVQVMLWLLRKANANVPLHSGHPVQFHVITSPKTFRKRIVLNLKLRYLKKIGKEAS